MENNEPQAYSAKSRHWTIASYVSCGVLLLVALSCGFLWWIFGGAEDLQKVSTESQLPAAEDAFNQVKETILSVAPHDTIQEKNPHSAGALQYAPSCLRLDEQWLLTSNKSLTDILKAINKTKVFYGWSAQTYGGEYYDYISKDGKIRVSFASETNTASNASVMSYSIDISYTSPSYLRCRA